MAEGFVFDDGGRAAAGFKGSTGDCVARSISIVSGKPYEEVYADLAAGNKSQRRTKHSIKSGAGRATVRHGIYTQRKWFKDYMRRLGFVWTPTMQIGSGTTVHLNAAELPGGKLVVAVSRHYTAMIDGVIHDTFDPRREPSYIYHPDGRVTVVGGRAVYGYWRKED